MRGPPASTVSNINELGHPLRPLSKLASQAAGQPPPTPLYHFYLRLHSHKLLADLKNDADVSVPFCAVCGRGAARRVGRRFLLLVALRWARQSSHEMSDRPDRPDRPGRPADRPPGSIDQARNSGRLMAPPERLLLFITHTLTLTLWGNRELRAGVCRAVCSGRRCRGMCRPHCQRETEWPEVEVN